MEKIKAVISSSVAILSSILGWLGWLAALYVLSMAVDYITSTVVMVKQRNWSSNAARRELWSKAGSLFAVLAAIITDILLYISINYSGWNLPFDFKNFLTPLVLGWYTITEIGSIIENAGKMGAPIPSLFSKILTEIQDEIEDNNGSNGNSTTSL